MDTTGLNEQQLRDYAANYLVLRMVACHPEQDERLNAAMAQATAQVQHGQVPTHEEFDRVMAILRGLLAPEGR